GRRGVDRHGLGGRRRIASQLRGRSAARLGAAGGRPGRAGAPAARPLGTLGALAPAPGRTRLDRSLAARHGVTLVDPNLHADAAEVGTRLEEAVLDVGPQRVQRDATLAVELGAAHLRA